MSANRGKPVVLLVVPSPDRYGLMALLQPLGYHVSLCENTIQATHYLIDHWVDLVVIDSALPGGAALTCCRELHRTSSVSMYPIILVGPDDADGTAAAAAFDAGADDFVAIPIAAVGVPARLRYHLESIKRLQAVSSISANASSAELAMILQFLEAEHRTGRMIVKHHGCKGTLLLSNGRLVHAEARGFLGLEALEEMLSWTSSTATFLDSDATAPPPSPGGLDLKTSEAITQAIARVASYRAAQRQLPPADTLFVPGSTDLPREASHLQRVVYEHALTGATVDDLMRDHELSRRQSTIALLELLEADHLVTAPPLFLDFGYQLYQAYRQRKQWRSLRTLKAGLEAVSFPLKSPHEDEETKGKEVGGQTTILGGPRPGHAGLRQLPTRNATWRVPAPTLVLTSNDPQLLRPIYDAMVQLHESLTRSHAAHRKELCGISITRFEFFTDQVLDVVQLPAVLDRACLRWLDQHAGEFLGVLLFTADHTAEATQQNLRLLRQLWARFKGSYHLVVPKLLTKDHRALFRLDCTLCGHRLAADMDDAGEQTTCPACQAAVTIPDCLDYLARTMGLPDDVPVVQVAVDRPKAIRDLLVLQLEVVLKVLDDQTAPTPEWTNETWTL